TLITDAPVTDANRQLLGQLAETGEVIWITPWGLSNEWTERPATDLTLHAAGGWMTSVGDAGREPLGPPGAQGQFVAGLYAAIAILRNTAGLKGGSADGHAVVDVSTVQAITATMIYDPVGFQYFGNIRQRVGNRFAATQPTITTQPCKDGFVGIHCALHGQWLALCQLIGHPELTTDPRFAPLLARAQNIVELDSYLQPWLAERTRFQAYHDLEAAHIPSSPLPDMAEVLDSPQLRARNSFRGVTTPRGRTYRVPGPPARVLAEAEPTPGQERPDGPWRPGRVRVADLSMGWAGPLVGFNLASFGADVIKVESHTHFDWWRGSRPPGDDPAQRLFEHSHVFNASNRGKRGITVNLATPRGRELALRFIGTADVLIENFGAGVLEKLGLTWDVLSAANPRLIMLRQPGFGSTGPEANYHAFGNTIEGMSGLTALMGYPGGPPMMMSNAFGDPVSGLLATVAVQAALAARERDGRGRLIECAQLEGFLPLVGEALIAYQGTGEVPPRRGNERPGHVPSGAFPCSGEDRWVAIDVESDAQWAALATVIDAPWAAA
ncbi:MAG: CoA transferase, partial [Tepidiformaceae bacterium]